MAKCTSPRDLNFRALVESLERVEKRRDQWQSDYIAAREKGKGKGKGKASGNAQPDSKGKGKGKDQAKDQGSSRDRAPSTNRWTAGSSSRSSTAGAWTAAAWTSNQWWSASGSADAKSSRSIATISDHQADNFFYIKVVIFVALLALILIGTFQVYQFFKKCFTSKSSRRKRQATSHSISQRTVGVQSQCT